MSPSYLVVIFFLLRARGTYGKKLSEEDLTFATKHVIQSIYTENGDIFDCFDVYKQPAFNHPLLKNHKLQVKPTFHTAEDTDVGASNYTSPEIGLKDGCPEGSVPVLRPGKSNAMDTYLNISSKANTSNGPLPWYPEYLNVHVAVYSTDYGQFYGAKGLLNVWNPHAIGSQYSDMKMTVVQGNDAIQAGWTVDRNLFGDDLTRLFGRWTVDLLNSKGWRSAGYVQVSRHFPLGVQLNPVSTHNGPQYYLDLRIVKDQVTSNWWLVWKVQKDAWNLGYWPKELFHSLNNFAGHVVWGGETYRCSSDLPWPEMGSGYGIDEGGYRKVAFIADLSVFKSNNTIVPVQNGISVFPRVNAKCVGVTPAQDIVYKGFSMYLGRTKAPC